MLTMQTTFTITIMYKTKFRYWHLHPSRIPGLEDMKILKRQNLVFDFYSCIRSTFTLKELLLR